MNSFYSWSGGPKLLLIAATFSCIASFDKPAIARADPEGDVKALQRRICYEDYWWGRHNFQLGKEVPVSLRKEGPFTYAWTEGLSVVPGSSLWANFFTVFEDGNQAIVVSSRGYNVDTMQGTSDFERDKHRVFDGQVQTVRLLVPSDCTPHFSGETLLKERMLKAIENTMAEELTLFNKSGGGHYPRTVPVIIANFNVDYPQAEVFIPSTDQVFYLTLRDASNPTGGSYLKTSEYPVTLESGDQSALKEKILRNGIARNIHPTR